MSKPVTWTDNLESLDWNELESLYRLAPLGNKSAALLPSHQGTGLGREMVKRLVEASRGHKKIILYSVPGKEGFYRKLGFMRLLTAMAIFDDQAGAIERGHLGEN